MNVASESRLSVWTFTTGLAFGARRRCMRRGVVALYAPLATVIVTAFVGATAARADIPIFNATCPQGIEVDADKGGPVFINGSKTQLKTFNENYYEASGSGVTISLSINPDGTPAVTYTAKGGANGICQVKTASVTEPSSGTASADVDLRGIGTVNGGGPTNGHLFKGRHGRYALLITATQDGFTCSGLMEEAPGTSKAMIMPITCTIGARGNATIRLNNSGKGFTVPFALSDGKGGYVLLR